LGLVVCPKTTDTWEIVICEERRVELNWDILGEGRRTDIVERNEDS